MVEPRSLPVQTAAAGCNPTPGFWLLQRTGNLFQPYQSMNEGSKVRPMERWPTVNRAYRKAIERIRHRGIRIVALRVHLLGVRTERPPCCWGNNNSRIRYAGRYCLWVGVALHLQSEMIVKVVAQTSDCAIVHGDVVNRQGRAVNWRLHRSEGRNVAVPQEDVPSGWGSGSSCRMFGGGLGRILGCQGNRRHCRNCQCKNPTHRLQNTIVHAFLLRNKLMTNGKVGLRAHLPARTDSAP